MRNARVRRSARGGVGHRGLRRLCSTEAAHLRAALGLFLPVAHRSFEGSLVRARPARSGVIGATRAQDLAHGPTVGAVVDVELEQPDSREHEVERPDGAAVIVGSSPMEIGGFRSMCLSGSSLRNSFKGADRVAADLGPSSASKAGVERARVRSGRVRAAHRFEGRDPTSRSPRCSGRRFRRRASGGRDARHEDARSRSRSLVPCVPWQQSDGLGDTTATALGPRVRASPRFMQRETS